MGLLLLNFIISSASIWPNLNYKKNMFWQRTINYYPRKILVQGRRAVDVHWKAERNGSVLRRVLNVPIEVASSVDWVYAVPDGPRSKSWRLTAADCRNQIWKCCPSDLRFREVVSADCGDRMAVWKFARWMWRERSWMLSSAGNECSCLSNWILLLSVENITMMSPVAPIEGGWGAVAPKIPPFFFIGFIYSRFNICICISSFSTF